MRKIAWLLGFLIIAVPAIASKVTVDPNVGGAKAIAAAPDIDTRLDSKITFEAKRKTVSSILNDLSKQTGVTFLAGYNNLDWQTRDRRMNIFAKDATLRSLIDSIAHVMKFKWSRTDKGGTWVYRLYMDRKTLLGAERERLMEEERLSELEAEQRAKLLDDLTNAAAMSDADLEKLKKDNPGLYVYSKLGWQYLMPSLFAQVPEANQAWSSGEALILNGADLPSGAQQAVLKTIRTMDEFNKKIIGDNKTLPADISNKMDKIYVLINYARKLVGYRGDTYIGDVTLGWPGNGNQTAFTNLDSEALKSMAQDYIRILDGQPVGIEQQSTMNTKHLRDVEEQKTDFGEPVIEHPDDPALLAKVKLKIEGDNFNDLLAAVAKASGYTIVSDSFRIDYRGLGLGDKEIPLKDVLDKITSVCRYNWEKPQSIIEFRDRDWFRKRAAQIPESWLEPWRKSLEDTGTLDINQFSQIALLDDEQFWENILPDDVLGKVGLQGLIFGYGDLLKGYACLNKSQQAAVFSSDGLDISAVLPAQSATIARIFRANSVFLSNPDAVVRLMGKSEQVEGRIKYSFTATSSANVTPMKWEFKTPHYEPPKKEATKEISKESASQPKQ